MDTDLSLETFLDNYATQPPQIQGQALSQIILHGGGTIIKPTNASTSGRPATHTWEIECLGVYARGFDQPEAIRNWFKVAKAVAQGNQTQARAA